MQHMKIRKKIVSTICLTLFGGLLYTNSSYAANDIKSTPSETEPSINIEKNIQNDISTKDLKNITEITASKEKDEVHIVSSTTLTEKDLAESDENALFVYDNGKLAGVEVNSQIVDKVSPEMVSDIIDAETVNDGDYVTITNCIEPEDGVIDDEINGDNPETIAMSPRGYGYYLRNGKAKKYGKEYTDKTKFITSVAKGASRTISKAVTLTCNRELSGEYYSTSITNGFIASISFKSVTKYGSSDMAAGKNCRKYYVKSCKQNYKRPQSKVNAKTLAVISTKTAIIKKPVKFIEYSVDVKIS